MTDWTAGYVADVGYTYGYYDELNPARLRVALSNAGLVAPQVRTACELGFGQGVSVNMHAAASDVQWFGTDFNPSQAGFAQQLAQECGSGADVRDQAFEEFCNRDDLPDFDFIGLHGIWSWISDANRAVIVDFVRRKLRVGGVLYVSYNTQPGWAASVPLRHLFTEHASVMSTPGQGVLSRVSSALEFVDTLFKLDPLYAKLNPTVVERFQKIKQQNPNYLAHEYFNRDWHPMPFARMAEWLEPAKMSYAAPAHYMEHIDAINLNAEQRKFLTSIPDANFRETVRDYLSNQQFRRDYWIKGPRRVTPLQQAEQLHPQRLMLQIARPDVSLKITGLAGEANLQPDIYEPILDALADHKPRDVAEIQSSLQGKNITLAQLQQAVVVMCAKGVIAPVGGAPSTQAKARCDRLNAHLMKLARSSADVSYLASPLTGGAVIVQRFEQLFLSALRQGAKTPEQWAAATWHILAMQNQKILKDGKTLDSDEENLAELTRQAHEFAVKRLPMLKVHGLAG